MRPSACRLRARSGEIGMHRDQTVGNIERSLSIRACIKYDAKFDHGRSVVAQFHCATHRRSGSRVLTVRTLRTTKVDKVIDIAGHRGMDRRKIAGRLRPVAALVLGTT